MEYDSNKHDVFDFLTFEYGIFDKRFRQEHEHLSSDKIEDLEFGLEMEKLGWGFLEEENCIIYQNEQRAVVGRTYFIVTPDKKIISTDSFDKSKLSFGNPESILLKKAADYFAACKSLLDETSFERAGSF